MRLTKTNYGDLPLVEDPTTGRARLVRGGVEHCSRTVANGHAVQANSCMTPGKAPQLGVGRLIGKPVSSPAPSPSAAVDPFDSKLEALRHRHLSMLILAGEVKRVKYHPFTIAIGPGKKYTPDFLVEYPDGRIVIEEVKGSLKMKNARDSVTRLHVAAGQLPMFSWRLVVGDAMEERLVA